MCDSPIRLKQERGTIYESGGRQLIHRWVDVPCGKCYPCIRTKRNDWIFRLTEQLNETPVAYFATLTYNNENLPTKADTGCSTLNYHDLQNYWKRLRKNNDDKLVYFAVGEYGTITKRPHYHAIIFNRFRAVFIHIFHYVTHGGRIDISNVYVTKRNITQSKQEHTN